MMDASEHARQPATTAAEPSVFLSKRLLPLSLFTVAFFFAYKYSAVFSFNFPAPLWFPDSVLLCALLLVPRRRWWLYLLVSLPIRLALEAHSPASLWFVLTAFANDSFKAALTAYLLQRFTSGPVRLNRLRQFTIFIGIAVILVPSFSAVVGGATRMAAGYDFWPSCYHWFLGDAIAALVITPTLLYWCLQGWREVDTRPVELVLLIAGFAASLYFSFLLPHSDYSPTVLYIAVPFLIWAAIRVGPIGTSTLNSLLALFSIFALVESKGPFSDNHLSHGIVSMQLFLAVTTVPMLFVAILIQERREVEDSLRESQASLQQQSERSQLLAHKLISSQEHERRKIARELHDHIGQSLALLSVGLDQATLAIPAGMSAEHSMIGDLQVRVDEIHDDVRALSHQLHSSVLQYLGLSVALRSLCRETAKQYQVVIDFQSANTDDVPQEVCLCVFRLTQEALNNALTHGQADKITVILQRDKGLLRICISDTGTGFNTEVSSDGLGLISMRERLRMVGGQLDVNSQLGKGTSIKAEVPLKEAA